MVLNEQVRHELIKIYSSYIQKKDDEKNKSRAYEVYIKYFNGANTLFNANVGTAIWGSFDLSEGRLSEDKAKKILEDLKKEE